MRASLLAITAVLVVAGGLLIAASLRRHDDDAARAGLIGMTAMIGAAIPALAYAGLTS